MAKICLQHNILLQAAFDVPNAALSIAGGSQMYYVKDNHEGIISREEFNRAQEELVRRSCRTPASGKTAITLQGKYSK